MTTERLLLEGELLPHHLPFLLIDGDERELEWTTTEANDGSLDELAQGDVDYAVTHPLNLIANVLAGEAIVGIARFFHTDCGIIHRKESDLETPADLNGDHEVGYHHISQEVTEAILNRAVKKDRGERPERWNLRNIPKTPLEALDNNEVDIILPGWIVPDGLQMQLGGINGDFWYFNDFNIPANGDLILVTSRERVEDDPNGILNFVHGVHQNLMEIKANSDRAMKKYSEERPELADDPVTEALLQSTIDGFTDIFSQDYSTYSSWSTFFNEETGVEGLVDIDQLIDERFLPVDAMSF